MDTQRVLAAACRAVRLAEQGAQVVVVVSAQGHTTDQMTALVQELTQEPSRREMDACLSAGEQMSAALMAMAIQSLGRDAVSLAGWQAGLQTDEVYGNARVLSLTGTRIQEALRQGKIVVVAGFQGINGQGDITTLGRGGSDTTAVALAAFLKADLCRIYTDVDGVYDKDPRKYPDAVRFGQIGYDDMLALARQGAQVLHDRSVELGKEYGVPIQVLSSFRPGPGTVVTDILASSSPKPWEDIPL